MVVDPAAEVHPTHVLNKDVHRVPLPSSDVHHEHRVSLQQALVNLGVKNTQNSATRSLKNNNKELKTRTEKGSYYLFCLVNGIFSIPNLQCWLASGQKIIVEAHPIDGHICTVMNPIQRRDKWRWL